MKKYFLLILQNWLNYIRSAPNFILLKWKNIPYLERQIVPIYGHYYHQPGQNRPFSELARELQHY